MMLFVFSKVASFIVNSTSIQCIWWVAAAVCDARMRRNLFNETSFMAVGQNVLLDHVGCHVIFVISVVSMMTTCSMPRLHNVPTWQTYSVAGLHPNRVWIYCFWLLKRSKYLVCVLTVDKLGTCHILGVIRLSTKIDPNQLDWVKSMNSCSNLVLSRYTSTSKCLYNKWTEMRPEQRLLEVIMMSNYLMCDIELCGDGRFFG